MNWIKWTVMVGLLVFLSACNDVEGQLDVFERFTFQNNVSEDMRDWCERNPDDYYCETIDWQNETTIFEPGAYEARLQVPNEEKIVLKVKGVREEGKEARFSFTLPEDVEIPEENGEFEILGEDIDQDFSVFGAVSTEVTETETRKGYERCTYEEERCYWRGDRQSCRTETRWGERYVEYYDIIKDKRIELDLSSSLETASLAQFWAVETTTNRNYLYRGRCL